MTLCIDSEKLVRESVDRSIREVFSMMIGVELTQSRASSPGPIASVACSGEPAMTVLLGLTGEIQGSLSLSLTEKAAIEWTRALIDHETDEVDQTVIDAVGELGNMVVGGVKRRLAGNNLTMSLPTVFRASERSLVFPTSTTPIHVGYEFADYTMTFVIALSNI
jgi:CheY-specific phosphatase CheX